MSIRRIGRMKKLTYYEKRGPKAIILFHAYTSSPLDVLSLGRALAREDYTVYMPTFDGHGLSDPDELLNYGINDWIKNGEDAYQKLVNDGYKNISVFGLSLGGIIATDLMLKHDVTAYGAFSSPLMPNQETNIASYFWQWYQAKKKALGATETDITSQEKRVFEEINEILHGINTHVIEMAQEYGKVSLPIFLGQGRLDGMIESTEVRKLKKEFKQVDVDFHCYQKAPHVITTGRAGMDLRKDLLAFLEKNV